MLNRVDELRNLEKQRLKLRTDLDQAYVDRREINDQIDKLRSQLQTVEREIAHLKPTDEKVTDQSVLRYLERTKGINVESIRLELANSMAKPKC